MAIRLSYIVENRREVLFGFHKRDASALAALGLRLKRHNALQFLGDDKVSHLDRNNGNAPIGNLLLYGIAKFLIELMAAHNHILQRGAADGIAQRRLRRKATAK